MEIWLIRNGEKSGPYPDYEIRSRIEHEELEADARVWHEGLAEWIELGSVELFKNEFDKKTIAEAPPLPSDYLERLRKNPQKDTTPRPPLHLMRRFWARWLDIFVYAALWWVGMYLAGRDIGSTFANPWMLLTMYVPWFALESWLIHRFQVTPGKWLLGLKVVNDDGSVLPLKNSVWRSTRVMVTGIGFGWGLLAIFCQTMSWFTARRIGKPIWDYLGGHKVVAKPLNPVAILPVVFLFIAAAYLHMAVLGPHVEKYVLEQNPEYEEAYVLWRPMYFPVKK